MPRIPTEPLTKVTLNLFSKDVEWFKDRFEYGYTEAIRDALRSHVRWKDQEEEYERVEQTSE
jgi:hypothetical protein